MRLLLLLAAVARGHSGVAVLDLEVRPEGVEVSWQRAVADDRRLPSPPAGCEALGPWEEVGLAWRARWSCAPAGSELRVEGSGSGPVRVVRREGDTVRRALSLGPLVRVPAPQPPDPPVAPVAGLLLAGLALAVTRSRRPWVRVLLHGAGLGAAWVLLGALASA